MLPSPTDLAITALNRLVGRNSWAAERLRGFAGEHVRLGSGQLVVHLTIGSGGRFLAGNPEAKPGVDIQLPGDFPLRFLTDRELAFRTVRISGSAELAETLGFVLRNLRWEPEDDLANLLGDIPASRLSRLAKGFVSGQRTRMTAVAANFSEYLTEEQRTLIGNREFSFFRQEVQEVEDGLKLLEARLQAMP